MIESILAFDNEDILSGDYLSNCANSINSILNSRFNGQINIRKVFNSDLTEDQVLSQTQEVYDLPYLFFSFSHGSEEALFGHNNQPFVSVDNAINLRNSFSYCYACLSGKQLGKTLIDQGCLCFIGHTDKVIVFVDYSDYFMRAATRWILTFCNGGTLSEVISAAYQSYTNEIIDLYTINPLAASKLLSNRDSLTLIGDRELTIDSFIRN